MTTSRKPAGGQPFEVVFDEPLAADAQQRFGLAIGQRAHAFAASRGEHHGLHLLSAAATARRRLRRALRLAHLSLASLARALAPRALTTHASRLLWL